MYDYNAYREDYARRNPEKLRTYQKKSWIRRINREGGVAGATPEEAVERLRELGYTVHKEAGLCPNE